MVPPAESPPFERLRRILSGEQADAGRDAAQTVMSPEFERVALTPGYRMQERLVALTALAVLAQEGPLPRREREVVLAELARLALRVLWWEGLLGPGMADEAEGDVAAAVLIELLASGCLPPGAASWMVLDRAKALLKRGDVVQALRENAPRRDRLLQQLIQAEARVRPLEL